MQSSTVHRFCPRLHGLQDVAPPHRLPIVRDDVTNLQTKIMRDLYNGALSHACLCAILASTSCRNVQKLSAICFVMTMFINSATTIHTCTCTCVSVFHEYQLCVSGAADGTKMLCGLVRHRLWAALRGCDRSHRRRQSRPAQTTAKVSNVDTGLAGNARMGEKIKSAFAAQLATQQIDNDL